MRWLKTIGIAVFVIALLIAGGVVYFTRVDPGRLKHIVERAISDATGRQLSIAGRFEPDIGLTSSLVATDITFANANWSEEPAMIHADRFAVSINLWSVIWRPVVVRSLELRGARVSLEVDKEGRANWEFGIAEDSDQPEEPAELAPIVFENVEVRDIHVVYRDQPDDRMLTVVIDQLTEHPDEKGLLNLDIGGQLNQRPIEIAGSVGPMENILADENVQSRLSGRIGALELELQGQIGELTTLSRPDLRLELHADKLSDVSDMLDLSSMGEGSLQARGRLSPAPAGIAVELGLELGAIRASATGSVDNLLDTKELDLSLTASGPNLAPLNAIVEGLPEGAFNVAGRLQGRDTTYTFDGVEARVGENKARLDGTLGNLPKLIGTHFEFNASGPDLSVFSTLAEIPLEAEPFVAQGRLDWEAGGLKLKGVNANIGQNRLELDGVLGSPPEMIGTSLRFQAQGPDFGAIPAFAAYKDAPAETFDIQGQLNFTSGLYQIAELKAMVGDLDLRASGAIGFPPSLKGTNLQVEAKGTDLSRLTPYARVDGLPSAPYSVSGQLGSRQSRYLVHGLIARVGSAELKLDGEVETSEDLMGTALKFHVSAPDLSIFDTLVEAMPLPKEPMTSSGRVSVRRDGYEVEEMTLKLGDATAQINGIVGPTPDLNGTDLKFDAAAPDLALLAPFLEKTELPKAKFSTAGQLRVNKSGYELRQTTAQLGNAKISLRGTIGRPPELSGTELNFDASAPDLALLAPFVEDLKLPQRSFSTSGRVRFGKKGYEFSDTIAKLGDASLRIDGTIAELSTLTDAEFTLLASGPNFAEIAEIANLTAPAAPFRFAARTVRGKKALRVHEASANVGENQLEFSGLLGEPPRFVGTNLNLTASGPDLGLVSQLAGLDRSLSNEPFKLSGHLDGSPEALQLEDFTASLGESDLSGSLDLDLRGKPELKGGFSSRYLDLAALLVEERSESVTEKSGADAKPAAPAPKAESAPVDQPHYLIPDTPLDLSGLNDINANIRFTGDKVRTVEALHSNVELSLRLQDGSLKLDPISSRDKVRGGLSATVALEPESDGYSVTIRGTTEQLRLGLLSAKDEDPANQPTLDIDVVFKGQGSSLHQIAASGNGHIGIVQGSGRINNSALNLLATNLSLELLDALNPFRKNETYTTVDCGVFGVKIVDGVATLDPFAARTDKLTLLGRGQVDLKTEKIDISWSARPRTGFGISASTITNPFVRLGGTLSSPAIGLNPTEAALATGAAVATAGLSILAQGVFDRLRGGQDVCQPALEKLRAETANPGSGKQSPP